MVVGASIVEVLVVSAAERAVKQAKVATVALETFIETELNSKQTISIYPSKIGF